MISVGRNHVKKNYNLILKIASILKTHRKLNFQFVIVGKDVKKLKGNATIVDGITVFICVILQTINPSSHKQKNPSIKSKKYYTLGLHP